MGIDNPVHLLFIAAVALIVLGPKRLPALARALGQAVREFRASLEEGAGREPEAEPPMQLSPAGLERTREDGAASVELPDDAASSPAAQPGPDAPPGAAGASGAGASPGTAA
jgi:TatA/E family protein of Tat protein translocase